MKEALAFLCFFLTIAALKGNDCNCTVSESLVKSLVQKELQQALKLQLHQKDNLFLCKCSSVELFNFEGTRQV